MLSLLSRSTSTTADRAVSAATVQPLRYIYGILSTQPWRMGLRSRHTVKEWLVSRSARKHGALHSPLAGAALALLALFLVPRTCFGTNSALDGRDGKSLSVQTSRISARQVDPTCGWCDVAATSGLRRRPTGTKKNGYAPDSCHSWCHCSGLRVRVTLNTAVLLIIELFTRLKDDVNSRVRTTP